jgi:hypothetical protein
MGCVQERKQIIIHSRAYRMQRRHDVAPDPAWQVVAGIKGDPGDRPLLVLKPII